jgi:site-specific recombinase XerD
LEREQVPDLVRKLVPGCAKNTAAGYVQSLGRWLKFCGRFALQPKFPPWQQWLDDYRHFLANHKGLAPTTVDANVRHVRSYLSWQFGLAPARWPSVTVHDLRRYCEHCARSDKPIYANERLFSVGRFLRFVQMHGACPAQLAYAIQHVANFGQPTHHKPVLSEKQRKRFVTSFPRNLPSGSRDYAMALCMADLGLRPCEVARLRIVDIDLPRQRMKLPAVKGSRERELPIPTHIAAALRSYVDKFRPASRSDRVFLRYHDLVGLPMTPWSVQKAMTRAYRRCGFPSNLGGAHLLRHGFATRLFARGVTIKEIADLLGHRGLHSTNLYTHVDPAALRKLALPWPV